jgi:thiamine biosynthesis lipoprotein ApbE
VKGNRMAALVCASATDSDALSTALLVLGPAGRDAVLRAAKSTRCWFA